MMPEMDGIEATKELRRMGVKSKIIALTANAVSGSKEEIIKAGMNAVVTKPFTISQMQEAVMNLTPAIDPELMEIFKTTTPQTIATIEQAMESGDAALFHIKIHGLKSALRNIEEEALAEEAYALEKAGEAGDTEKIESQTPELFKKVKAICN
jgi:CheY-like chemotaxis protein